MASSLAPACTPSKHTYDTCFNHWFASYLLLISPTLPLDSNGSIVQSAMLERAKKVEEKKKEYEDKCGASFRSYNECLRGAIAGKEGLAEMLETARKEEPLHSWGGIKVISEDDI